MIDLFSFATPSDVFPTEACLKNFTICDDSDCLMESIYSYAVLTSDLDLLIRLDAPQEPLNIYVAVR